MWRFLADWLEFHYSRFWVCGIQWLASIYGKLLLWSSTIQRISSLCPRSLEMSSKWLFQVKRWIQAVLVQGQIPQGWCRVWIWNSAVLLFNVYLWQWTRLWSSSKKVCCQGMFGDNTVCLGQFMVICSVVAFNILQSIYYFLSLVEFNKWLRFSWIESIGSWQQKETTKNKSQ